MALVHIFMFYFRLTFHPHTFSGVNAKWLDQVLGTQSNANANAKYKTLLIERLLQIVHISGQLCKFTMKLAS